MKISLVPKPIPSDAIVQIQKNNLMRQISTLENSQTEADQTKVVQLRQKLKEIDREREDKIKIEKKELMQMYQNSEDKKKDIIQKTNDNHEEDNGNIINPIDNTKNTFKSKVKTVLGKYFDKRF